MNINNTRNVFARVANSEWGEKTYRKLLSPSNETFLKEQLPVIESVLVSSFYCLATAVQDDIPKENKDSLQIQNVLSFISSVAIASPINKKLSKFADEVVKNLDTDLMKNGKRVADGLKIGLPIVNTLLVARYLVASAIIPMSTSIRNAYNERKNGLDVKA